MHDSSGVKFLSVLELTEGMNQGSETRMPRWNSFPAKLLIQTLSCLILMELHNRYNWDRSKVGDSLGGELFREQRLSPLTENLWPRPT